MKYLMVVLAPFYRVDNDTIACEGAFAEHLREMLPRVKPWADEIVVHAFSMSKDEYLENKHHMGHIDCTKERISYIDGPLLAWSRSGFAIRAPFLVWPTIWKAVTTANVVHSSASKDVLRLFTFMSLLFAAIQGKKSILVMDIDHRASAEMLYKTGKFSRKSYLISRYFYSPLVSLQLRFAARYCNLLMLKGKALAEDFGKGKPHVKNFYNTVHDSSFVLNDEELQRKLDRFTPHKTHIRLVYFGRVVAYKGIDDMIEATQKVASALQQRANQQNNSSEQATQTVSLTIVGEGETKAELERYVKDNNLGDSVHFVNALSYGEELFDELEQYDFLLAAPNSEDTPRSVFDAMACGLPIIAYDTYYYKDLESSGAPVRTVPWKSTQAMADKILELVDAPDESQKLIRSARDFAANNTQDIWLTRRLDWTKEFLS